MPREKPGWLVAFQRIASGQALDSQNIRLADPARRAEKVLLQDSLDLRLCPAWIVLGGSGFLESGQWLYGFLSFWSLQRNRIGGERAGVSLPKLFSWALNSLIVNAKTWASQYQAGPRRRISVNARPTTYAWIQGIRTPLQHHYRMILVICSLACSRTALTLSSSTITSS